LGDLINEGNIGLIKAASKFDETKGFRFISFAVHWIRQLVMQAVTEQTRTVKLPFNQVYGISRTNKACAKLEQELQRSPSVTEIAEHMGVEELKIEDYLTNGRLNVSLNMSVNEDKDRTLMEILKCDCPDTDDHLIKSSLTENLLQLVNSLPKREAQVMRLFLGIGEEYPLGLDDIAIILCLSKERVRQVKDKALKELRRRGKPFLSKLGIFGASA
jgi:RNA polymerase primary sigma factor